MSSGNSRLFSTQLPRHLSSSPILLLQLYQIIKGVLLPVIVIELIDEAHHYKSYVFSTGQRCIKKHISLHIPGGVPITFP
jgi:hypothetical protein